MKAGRYYIGDPCYVLNEENGWDWSDVCDQTDCFGQHGEYTIIDKHGREYEIAVVSTKWGDGTYESNINEQFGVDAGIIGVVPVEALNGEEDRYFYYTFDRDFLIDCDDEGTITIGNIKGYIEIYTD